MSLLFTYSGSAINGVLSGIFGSIQFGGIAQTGVGQITIRMTVEHASIKGSMDGAAVTSWTPGEWGEIDIEVYQTSSTQKAFLLAYNEILAGALLSVVQPTFSSTLIILDSVTGAIHTATGVAFPKVPDKGYGAQAELVHWNFKCANIINE